jgi:hypothetical protein
LGRACAHHAGFTLYSDHAANRRRPCLPPPRR